MQVDLFSKPAQYTIDSCSLMDIFNDAPVWTSKAITPGLWSRIESMIADGTIISHIEVFQEIKTDGKKGVELYDWAQLNKQIFRDHRPEIEGPVIAQMTAKYSEFVNGKLGSAHADPWLIAQAKCDGLKVITEETFSGSARPSGIRIPNVCADQLFGVKTLNLIELAQEQGWQFN
jgi:hypothetical protein